MKLISKNIERNFFVSDKDFYTKSIRNRILDVEYENLLKTEFIINFVDGMEIYSNNMFFEILENTDEKIVIRFFKEGISLRLVYSNYLEDISKEIIVEKSKDRINYIDCDVFEFEDINDIYSPKKQEDIKEMANFSGYYVEMGQPVFANSLFFGMEFPMAENRIIDGKYFSRYYLGKSITDENKIWRTVIGASNGFEKKDIQRAFFRYIEKIAQKSYFRKQYNSWYDHMLDISDEIIQDSFKEIHKGFAEYGIELDAYVVDDGWADYESVWEFNSKFPNELRDISKVVKGLNSTLGLWIGPRGGYGGTQRIMSDWLEKNRHLNIGSKNKLSNDVNVGDFNYLRKMREKMLEYQVKYDISYWKIDGLLLKPDTPDESGDFAMYTMTAVYEFLVDMFEELREKRNGKEMWINLTSYVNPSPWFLKWVNSLWIQTSEDVTFTENAGNDINRMMTYRDSQYHEFLLERDIQLPLWSLYNHEPIYASTAHRGYLEKEMYCSIEDFEKYLMFISTRGNGFWEFYYSYKMFEKERWEVNAKVLKWIEENYSILKNSRFFGVKADNFGIYGYICEDEESKRVIISFRNSSNETKEYTLNLENNYNLNRIFGEGEFKLKDGEVVVNLKPYEVLILGN